MLQYCVDVADVCGIRNGKINFGLLPYIYIGTGYGQMSNLTLITLQYVRIAAQVP